MGYHIRRGSSLDRALLLKLLGCTYRELLPTGSALGDLATFVEDYLSPRTPLWWAYGDGDRAAEGPLPGALGKSTAPWGGLWLAPTRDRATGDPWAQILWIYVQPDHRRQGIATALLATAEAEAQRWGSARLALQVFDHNSAAIALYHRYGFGPHSRVLTKAVRSPGPLPPGPPPGKTPNP